MKRTLIRGGELITAEESFKADLLIEGERIALIEEDIDPVDVQIIEAQGKFVLPGGIDPHVHLDYILGGLAPLDLPRQLCELLG